MEDRLLNIEQAAAALGVSRNVLTQWRSKNKGPPWIALNDASMGKKTIRYSLNKLNEWLKDIEHPGAPVDVMLSGVNRERNNRPLDRVNKISDEQWAKIWNGFPEKGKRTFPVTGIRPFDTRIRDLTEREIRAFMDRILWKSYSVSNLSLAQIAGDEKKAAEDKFLAQQWVIHGIWDHVFLATVNDPTWPYTLIMSIGIAPHYRMTGRGAPPGVELYVEPLSRPKQQQYIRPYRRAKNQLE
jgi:hypothetical protein